LPLHSRGNALEELEAEMKDAEIRQGVREPQVPAALLESVRELNHRFLELVAVQADDWNSSRRAGLPMGVSEQLAPLSTTQKNAAANCPYVLFDLRFDDAAWWSARLLEDGRWHVADAPPVDEHTLQFASLALFFAWHVASTGGPAPRLLLGMGEATAAAFRTLTVDRVPSVAVTVAGVLTARWSNCANYWFALAAAASRTNVHALRRIQLYGLQLAAAARLA
jgi:hypothetical protein